MVGEREETGEAGRRSLNHRSRSASITMDQDSESVPLRQEQKAIYGVLERGARHGGPVGVEGRE